MVSGYSKTPLVKKLGIKAGFKMRVIDPPPNYWDLLGSLPEHVSVHAPGEAGLDVIHVFVRDRQQIEDQIEVLRESIAPAGMIWVSWPKKSSRAATDLSENVIRDLALKNGLVDTKVCAVDETWSGLKLVIRLRDRA
jgi:hypothetical protein